jgi:hypothetical protein
MTHCARTDRFDGPRGGVRRRALLALVAVALLAGLACASAPPPPTVYAIGSTIEAATLEDQHGDSRSIDATVRVVLFSRDMDGGGMIREVLTAEPELLERTSGVYVADISGMPTLIANMMAIPSMRKRPYPMLLDRDGSVTAAYPSAEGMATVIRLNAFEILEIHQHSSIEALRATLEAATEASD